MAHTTAVTEIGKIVDKYVFKHKLSQDDWFVYLQHACDVFRNVNLRHGNNVVTAKVTISALGIIEMPTDMIGFSNLFIPIDGEFWSFSDVPRKVTTTTTTLGVEGQDSLEGEGVDVKQPPNYQYSSRGNNEYGRKIDWAARRIFCDGIKSDTAVLQYTSSGLVVSGTTYVPQEVEAVIDAYLNWKRTEMNPKSQGSITYYFDQYERAKNELRIIRFTPTKDEIEDAWNTAYTRGLQG